MGKIVIVAYRPKPGKESTLIKIIREHVPLLKKEGLVTEREPFIMQASDKTIIEVFEWKSAEAIAAAHTNTTVQKLWERFSDACDYVPAHTVKEFSDLFAEFKPVI